MPNEAPASSTRYSTTSFILRFFCLILSRPKYPLAASGLSMSVKAVLSCQPVLNHLRLERVTLVPQFICNTTLLAILKGQMHHHDDLGSKCPYTCHLSNKTTHKSVLLSTPQVWLMKFSKQLSWGWHYQKWCLGSDCQPCFWLVERYQWLEVTATDISQPIRNRAGSHFLSTTSDNVSLYTQTQASFSLTFISHIWGVLRRTDLRVVLFERWHV